MRLAVLLSAAAVLLMPATAANAGAPGAWQRKALDTAQRVWHPSCGLMRLTFGDPAASGAARDDGTPAINPTGWNNPEQCEITISQDAYWMGYPEFCTVVLHEAGHVAGRPHSDRGIMRAEPLIIKQVTRIRGRTVVTWAGADRRCLRRGDH